MATVEYGRFQWSRGLGPALEPGQVHNWWLTHSSHGDLTFEYGQVNVTAHPWVFLPHYLDFLPSELSVDNVRSRAGSSGRTMYFRVTNTGPNPVHYYGIGVSFVDE